MKVVYYWHGAIKNYRYDGDISIAKCFKEIIIKCSLLVYVEVIYTLLISLKRLNLELPFAKSSKGWWHVKS